MDKLWHTQQSRTAEFVWRSNFWRIIRSPTVRQLMN